MKSGRFLFLLSLAIFGFSLATTLLIHRDHGSTSQQWPADSPLPRPSSMTNAAFEDTLYPFVLNRTYATLPGWAIDKRVRDTGPYIDGNYYGVHPAVRIYYSPNVYRWLKNGRPGDAPEGSIIIKEMFPPPAAIYTGASEERILDSLRSWTIMIRDSEGSWDGWYWGAYSKGQEVDNPRKYNPDHGYYVAESGFATYCMRCHASAKDMLTFSSTDNIKGEPGDPILYHFDNSWMPRHGDPEAYDGEHSLHRLFRFASILGALRSPLNQNVNYNAFTAFFNERHPLPLDSITGIPPRPYDHVPSGPKGPMQFITSDNCMPCHSASASLATDTNMFVPDVNAPGGKGWNVSPYGEWQGSMMGLAGRDPIFFAQLESEKAIHHQDTLPDFIQNTCLSCHGVMGQRQFHIDGKGKYYREEMMYAHGPDKWEMYGGLSRDGISCMVCHQIVDDGKPLLEIATGKFEVSRPGQFGKENGRDVSYVWGPYQTNEVIEHPMFDGLGVRPKYSSYIKESRLCGSCHTVYLPVFKADGKPVPDPEDPNKQMHFFEQTTYIEWQNSAYQNEYRPYGSDVKTCQNCHMPTTFPYTGKGMPLRDFKIANVQDESYPQADHLAPYDSIFVRRRDTFHRHTLLGINQFGLEFFNQFDSLLGNYKKDYMTGTPIMPQAIAASNNLAMYQTAEVNIRELSYANGRLRAAVQVNSLVGHRFPSGVGFRRAFLEFAVLNARGDTIWASGRTNSLGVILGADGRPLPSEFFEVDPVTGQQRYQPHHDTIFSPDQVQIYQELARNFEGKFTTSFVALYEKVKDNRLLPKGWTWDGPPGMDPLFVEETRPHGRAEKDPDFGAGGDKVCYDIRLPGGQRPAKVVATLYYQAIPPFYLRDRFATARGKDGNRLYYLASHLETTGTNIENWKLVVGRSQVREVR